MQSAEDREHQEQQSSLEAKNQMALAKTPKPAPKGGAAGGSGQKRKPKR
jgi:hypothetical protein